MSIPSLKSAILSRIRPLLRIPLVGLDISDENAKYFSFRQGAGGRLAPDRWGKIPLPHGCIREGEMKNPDAVGDALRQWHESEKSAFSSSFFVLSLPEEKGFVRTIQLPKLAQDQIREAVRWEIEAHVPLPEKDIVYDYEIIEPIEDNLDHRDVLVSAFPKDIIASYFAACSRAGIRVAALELKSQAIVRSSLPHLRDPNAVLIVDIGRLRTGFFLVGGGTTIFTSTVQIGGKTLEERISQTFGTDQARAQALKKEIALETSGAGDGRALQALVPVLSALTDELRKAQKYFSAYVQHRHGISPDVRSVILTGGDANLAGLDLYISKALEIPAERSFPFSALKDILVPADPPLPDSESLRYAAAMGLALRGMR